MEKRKSLAKEIFSRWDYWQSKFIAEKIMVAQKVNCFISNCEVALKAMTRCADGWLLLAKNFDRQLYKSRKINALFNKSDELKNQVERFLARENNIEIIETGLLKNFSGIVLLKKRPSSFTNEIWFTNPVDLRMPA
ncbi:hypothetical protein BH10BAC2_BH10BAC2_03570 [soil metagenome]